MRAPREEAGENLRPGAKAKHARQPFPPMGGAEKKETMDTPAPVVAARDIESRVVEWKVFTIPRWGP